ncbi:MFS transporter [Mycobacterium simiae]|uniref:MFS transporter n=1 Tax=Mycobacterium simiae TaxID=1784 RepID=UPI0015943B78|nr:MFS transporter [Mycobacterium simiae]
MSAKQGSQLLSRPLSPLGRLVASASGTLIEWYDFFVYGSLATVMAKVFFPAANAGIGLLVTLAGLGAGFVMRPLGALYFGRLGDERGRKKTFITTLSVMGIATTSIGLLPTYSSVGVLAPILLVFLRLAQGFCIGGEYGGAATYVGEHAPAANRGRHTSYLQATQTLGVLIAVLVIIVLQLMLGADAFSRWGWRIPFVLSAALIVVSLRIRLRLDESPVFEKLERSDTVSAAPVRAVLGNWRSLKTVLLAVFGVTAGMGATWHCAHAYSLVFLQNSMKVEFLTANLCFAAALAIGTPFFVVFGVLSDRWGRLPLITIGLMCLAVSTVPMYALIRESAELKHYPQIVVIIAVQVIFVAMVNGPVGAYLLELFSPEVRTTGVSVAYHLGTGIFGGFSPLIAQSLAQSTGNILSGIAYPTTMAALSAIVSAVVLATRWKRTRVKDPAVNVPPAQRLLSGTV